MAAVRRMARKVLEMKAERRFAASDEGLYDPQERWPAVCRSEVRFDLSKLFATCWISLLRGVRVSQHHLHLLEQEANIVWLYTLKNLSSTIAGNEEGQKGGKGILWRRVTLPLGI